MNKRKSISYSFLQSWRTWTITVTMLEWYISCKFMFLKPCRRASYLSYWTKQQHVSIVMANSPLSWKTKTLCIVRSTLSAETSAMVDALDINYFLSNVLSEILFLKNVFHKTPDNQVPILAFTDNESLFWTVHSTVMTNE